MSLNKQTYQTSMSLQRRIRRAIATIQQPKQLQAELQQCRAIYSQLLAQGLTTLPALPSTLRADPLQGRAPALQRKTQMRMKAMARRILCTPLQHTKTTLKASHAD